MSHNSFDKALSMLWRGGMSPMMVSQITGHDPQVMFNHYAGVIDSTPKAPDVTTKI